MGVDGCISKGGRKNKAKRDTNSRVVRGFLMHGIDQKIQNVDKDGYGGQR